MWGVTLYLIRDFLIGVFAAGLILAVPIGTIGALGYPRVPHQKLVEYCGASMFLLHMSMALALHRPELFPTWAPSLALALIPLALTSAFQTLRRFSRLRRDRHRELRELERQQSPDRRNLCRAGE